MPANKLGLYPEGSEQAFHNLNFNSERSLGLKVRLEEVRPEVKRFLPEGVPAAHVRNSLAQPLKKRQSGQGTQTQGLVTGMSLVRRKSRVWADPEVPLNIQHSSPRTCPPHCPHSRGAGHVSS